MTTDKELVHDLQCNHVALSTGRSVADRETIYSRAIDEITRLQMAVETERIELITWVLRRVDWHGCFSGDCPHDEQDKCVASVLEYYDEDKSQGGGA